MARRLILVAMLFIGLAGVGAVLLPTGPSNCGTPISEAFKAKRTLAPFDPLRRGAGGSSTAIRNSCQKPAKDRLRTVAVVEVLSLVGAVGAIYILRNGSGAA